MWAKVVTHPAGPSMLFEALFHNSKIWIDRVSRFVSVFDTIVLTVS